jgi:hypothetical protein
MNDKSEKKALKITGFLTGAGEDKAPIVIVGTVEELEEGHPEHPMTPPATGTPEHPTAPPPAPEQHPDEPPAPTPTTSSRRR